MISDGDKQIKPLERKTKKTGNNMFIFKQFFSTFWIRCSFSFNNGFDKILLDYGYNFLPYIGCFFYFLYFITKIK